MSDRAEFVDPATGEVLVASESLEDAAAVYADLIRQARVLKREADDAYRQYREADTQAQQLAAALLAGMEPGDSIGPVVCVHGRRRNARINKDGIEEHVEQLQELGLVDVVQPPTPPPVFRPASVSRIRASEKDLARRGVRIADLVVEGGPGDPTLEVVD